MPYPTNAGRMDRFMDIYKTAREVEDGLLRRCVAVALGESSAADNQVEANVFRVAGMLISHRHPDEGERLQQAAREYFHSRPDEEINTTESVRRGWISSLPRLNDELRRRLRG